MFRPAAVAVVVLVAALGVPASAIFLRQESRQVPVDRLVANLERAAKDQPKDPQLQINLARLHAMAYALKTADLPATTVPGSNIELPYYSPGASQVANKVAPAASPEDAATAARHLKSAIEHYDAALALAPDNMTARLGRGWVLQQAGETSRAIDDYRRAITIAWPQEEKIKMLMPSQRFITQEAIEYLLPLLDPKRDAAEIDDLRVSQKTLLSRPRAITPIAVPLDDDVDPRSLVDPRARVRFDADGSALDREWTWLTPRAGWLVYDAAGRGQITSALQLFGNVTFWLFWSNGYDALRALDDDGSGRIEGGELRHLAVWQDANANGHSEHGEVLRLESLGIIALSYDHRQGDGDRIAAFSTHGITLRNGRTRPTYDVILRHADITLTH
jgi:tetratricopeptide (TPR) repeat protein